MTGEAEAFARGVTLFNERSFWHAHEAWESIWLEAPRQVASYLQGLIQIAAAYHHLQRGTVRGAARLFDSALRRLESYPPDFCGVAREALVAAAAGHGLFAAEAAGRLVAPARVSAERIPGQEYPSITLAAEWEERLRSDLTGDG